MKKLLGHCPVDSGQLIFIDPCYLAQWKDGDYPAKDGNHYAKACEASLSKEQGGEVLVSNIAGNGVVSSTGYGDGNYPVYATYKDGRIQKIEIKFF